MSEAQQAVNELHVAPPLLIQDGNARIVTAVQPLLEVLASADGLLQALRCRVKRAEPRVRDPQRVRGAGQALLVIGGFGTFMSEQQRFKCGRIVAACVVDIPDAVEWPAFAGLVAQASLDFQRAVMGFESLIQLAQRFINASEREP